MRIAQITGGVVQNVVLVNPERVPEFLADCPEVPDECGPGWTFDGEAFHAPEPDPVSVDQVKAEAHRRIIALCPEWKQRNLNAQFAILERKGARKWTKAERAAWNAGEALWGQINAIRTASDEIEAMDPIPADFNDDKYWPEASE